MQFARYCFSRPFHTFDQMMICRRQVFTFFSIPKSLRSQPASFSARRLSCSASSRPSTSPSFRYAVIGGGFAGVAISWHLISAAKQANTAVSIDLFDAYGLGAGGSGAAAGLLHPYNARGKPLYKGLEAFQDALELVAVAEGASDPGSEPIAWRQGLLRAARTQKQAAALDKFVHKDAEGYPITGAHCITGSEMAWLVPGMCPDTLLDDGATSIAGPAAAGMMIPGALVLHPARYLAAVWHACQQAAVDQGSESSSTNEEYSSSESKLQGARLIRKTITSLQQLDEEEGGGGYDAVIVAAGAAIHSISELQGILPLELCQGYTLDLKPNSTYPQSDVVQGKQKGAYPPGAPSLLGSTYLAAHGDFDLVVGATKNFNITPEQAFQQCAQASIPLTHPDVVDAVGKLVPAAAELWPPVAGWEVTGVRSGVRAIPSRSEHGSVPYLGQVPGSPKGRWWVVGGLGARGLVYHAWLGRLVAGLVVGREVEVLPKELTRWHREIKLDSRS